MPDRYALPPETGPMPEHLLELEAVQPMLWIGSCSRCGGRGIVQLELDEADPADWYACPRCDGSGLDDAGHPERRRLRDG